MFDAVIFIAIITASITTVTIAVKTIIEIEQQSHYLNQKSETINYRFIDMVYKIHHVRNGDLSDSSEEQIKDFMKFSKEKTI